MYNTYTLLSHEPTTTVLESERTDILDNGYGRE